MSEYTYHSDGRVFLSTEFDPAIETVTGHSRFFLGLDLGRNDPSALVLLHDEQLPVYAKPHRQRRGARQRTVVWADRVKDTAYTALARHVASLLAKPALQERPTQLVVDVTGLGTPFCDVLTEGGIQHLAVTMTAGQNWSRKGHRVNVAKNVLLESLATGFETQALTISEDLPLRGQLVQEVQSFELATTAAGNLILSGGGQGHHADMAIALALAWFASEHLQPQRCAVHKLRGAF